VLALTACAAAPHPIDNLLGRSDVVALTNLHPDPERNWLSAANYQQFGLIPVCSQVSLLELSSGHLEVGYQPRNRPSRDRERLHFREEATRKTHEYFNRSDTGEPFQDHLARYFGDACPAALQTLSEIDRRGVSLGKPLVGMSKQGVIFAMGYPPLEATPSLDSKRWIYWLSRFDVEAVEFDDTGHVTLVDEN
jgi:hypothetical protein